MGRWSAGAVPSRSDADMLGSYGFPVLLSPVGQLYYLHGTTGKVEFVAHFRSTKVTSHNINVLLEPGSGNLSEGTSKAHCGGWIVATKAAWLESDRGDLIYYFGDPPADAEQRMLSGSVWPRVAQLHALNRFSKAAALAAVVFHGSVDRCTMGHVFHGSVDGCVWRVPWIGRWCHSTRAVGVTLIAPAGGVVTGSPLNTRKSILMNILILLSLTALPVAVPRTARGVRA